MSLMKMQVLSTQNQIELQFWPAKYSRIAISYYSHGQYTQGPMLIRKAAESQVSNQIKLGCLNLVLNRPLNKKNVMTPIQNELSLIKHVVSSQHIGNEVGFGEQRSQSSELHKAGRCR